MTSLMASFFFEVLALLSMMLVAGLCGSEHMHALEAWSAESNSRTDGLSCMEVNGGDGG